MKSAPIYFNEDYKFINEFLKSNSYSKIFLLVDENTHEYCLPRFVSELEDISDFEIIEVPPGEEFKEIETTTQIWLSLSELNADRKSLMINLGGGVITDMGGFIASTFKRGIDFLNVPTTLLSMVDASVGGKNGIDLNGMKNQIGTFTQPKMVWVDAEFLNTLEERQFMSGMAEMLKHGLIADANHWESLISLPSWNPKNISPLIQKSVEIKKEVVESDPYESGLRKILNFGHTIGHAIESEFLNSEKPLLHGEAIIMGMMIESLLSKEKGLLLESECEQIFNRLNERFSPTKISESLFPKIMNWMKHDKKNENKTINFSLIDEIGSCKYNLFLSSEQIIEALKKYNEKL